MPTTIDWGTKIITVQQADMIQVQTTPIPIYQLNVNDFHLDLRDLEDSDLGMAYPQTHTYKAPTTLSGVTYARLMEVVNGYTVEFDPDGSTTPYVVQVVGGNSNVGDVIQPQPGVSVQVANSAGLQDAESLQAASFQGSVALDITSSFSGVTFPVGTRQNPVNNLADARQICIDRGLRTISILSDTTTLTAGDFSDGYTFIGESPIITTVTIDAATNVTNCRFQNMYVQGTLDNNNEFRECIVGDIEFFNGGMLQCALTGTITLAGGVQAQIYDSWSGIADHSLGQYAEIDLGGTGQDLVLRNYTGGIRLTNSSGPANVSMDVTSGRVFLESSITDGDIEIRGNARVQDESTGTTIVRNETLNQAQELAAFEGKVTIDPIAGTTGEYEYPYGTPGSPVLTLADANTIAAARGITELAFLSSYTFLSGDDVSDKLLSGRGPGTVLTFQSGSVTTRTNFQACTVEGTISSFGNFNFCHFRDVTDNTVGTHALVQFQQCSFDATWTFGTAHIASMELLYCVTGATAKSLNAGRASFDFNGADVDVAFRNYSGAMEISGISNALADVSVDFFSGSVTADATNTAGQLILRGDAIVTDNSNGTTVTNDTIHEAVEAGSFNGHVTVDETNVTGIAVAGTEFPAGTDEAPSNNLEDAITILRSRGLIEMRVIGTLALDGGLDLQGITFFCRLLGGGITIDPSVNVTRTAFTNLNITGTFDEQSSLDDCMIYDVTSVRARARGTGMSGTISLSGTGTSSFENCFAGYPQGQTGNTTPAHPIIDMGGSGQNLLMEDWNGLATIRNLTDANAFVMVTGQSGTITIDSTVTAGTITVAGFLTIVDNSSGTAVVVDNTDRSKLCKVADRIDADHDIVTSPGELIVTKANTATELDRYDLDDTDGATFDPTGTKGIGRRTRQ